MPQRCACSSPALRMQRQWACCAAPSRTQVHPSGRPGRPALRQPPRPRALGRTPHPRGAGILHQLGEPRLQLLIHCSLVGELGLQPRLRAGRWEVRGNTRGRGGGQGGSRWRACAAAPCRQPPWHDRPRALANPAAAWQDVPSTHSARSTHLGLAQLVQLRLLGLHGLGVLGGRRLQRRLGLQRRRRLGLRWWQGRRVGVSVTKALAGCCCGPLQKRRQAATTCRPTAPPPHALNRLRALSTHLCSLLGGGQLGGQPLRLALLLLQGFPQLVLHSRGGVRHGAGRGGCA